MLHSRGAVIKSVSAHFHFIDVSTTCFAKSVKVTKASSTQRSQSFDLLTHMTKLRLRLCACDASTICFFFVCLFFFRVTSASDVTWRQNSKQKKRGQAGGRIIRSGIKIHISAASRSKRSCVLNEAVHHGGRDV